MAAIKAGDKVRVVKRSVAAEDVRSGLYYQYFGGLTGKVDRLYDDQSACIEVDLESLDEPARESHLAMQEGERTRWVESIAQEARSRLSPEQQKLRMSYKILVSKKDLEEFAGSKSGRTKSEEPKALESQTEKPAPSKAAESPKKAAARIEEQPGEEPVKRISQAELDAAEEAMLKAQEKASDT